MGITVREIGTFTCSVCESVREVNPYDLDKVWRVAISQHCSADAALDSDSWFLVCEPCAHKVLRALGELTPELIA